MTAAAALFLVSFFLFFILGALARIAKSLEAISAFYVDYTATTPREDGGL